MNVYLFITLVRLLVVAVIVLALVAASAFGSFRQPRRLRERGNAALPGIIEHRAHRRAA